MPYQDGQTPLDEDETDGLLIKSITTRGELDEAEQLNIQNAVEWTLKNNFRASEILSEKFIKQLHQKMFGDVWRWAGTSRKSNKNMGVDKYLIDVELRKLLADTEYMITNKTYPEDELAIRFKYRIVTIHCFANGNGRHSRLMADVIVSHIFGKDIFSWGMQNPMQDESQRTDYINAMREADRGNIQSLLQFARS